MAYQYQTINESVEGIYKDRGSKFISYLQSVRSSSDIQQTLETIRSMHPKARHLCYAYRLGIEGEPYRINDDGEPSGTAGRPIYNELLSARMSDVLCVVVRYFGGTKLGASGLIRAYKGAAYDAISQADLVTVTLSRKVKIFYQMKDLGKLYNILKLRGFVEISSHFEPEPNLEIAVNLNELDQIRAVILADYMGYGVGDIKDDFECGELRVEIVE